MQILTRSIPIDHFHLTDGIQKRPIILLDIETTGLSPDMSALFMIGCAFFEPNRLSVCQWLADSLELEAEQDILDSFSQWLFEHFDISEELYIITYNGQNFDLPFLKSRYAQCRRTDPLTSYTCRHMDLYRELLPLKALWPVRNMKLKSLGAWLGYHGHKTAEGRQLIKAYHEYIKTKDSDILNLLSLHNMDDLKTLYTALPLYHYRLLFRGSYRIADVRMISDDLLEFHLTTDLWLPAALDTELNGCHLSSDKQSIRLQLPIHPRGLRYYYSDFKNYVYLPDEDCALHKSMATYIDRSHWQKATRETCYTWFLPDEDFLNNEPRQRAYLQMLFQLFGFF
jgi:uncharacterized protein YprB with RNaseH-like and TPR domain